MIIYLYTFILVFIFQIYQFVNIDFLILIPADLYYINMVRNFYISTIKYYNIKHFKVVATSLNMYKKCKENDIPVDLSPKLIQEKENENKIHTVGFAKKMRLKNPIFLKYLKTTKYLLALDADIFFFQNPIVLLKYLNLTTDILLVCDNSECTILNYGLMYNIIYIYSLDCLETVNLQLNI